MNNIPGKSPRPRCGEEEQGRGAVRFTALSSAARLLTLRLTRHSRVGTRAGARPLTLTLSPAAGARGQGRRRVTSCNAPCGQNVRSGAAMVYVLILLLVISMIGGTLVRGAVAVHRQRQKDEIHAQTVRLAEAGWNRALRALAKSPEYQDETWSVAADALGPDRTASIRIAVAAESNAKRLTVVAEYPLDDPNLNRVTLTGLVHPHN